MLVRICNCMHSKQTHRLVLIITSLMIYICRIAKTAELQMNNAYTTKDSINLVNNQPSTQLIALQLTIP